MISGGFLLILVMMSSADQEVKQNLISIVGGDVTIPELVKSDGLLLKHQLVVAFVTDSVLKIRIKVFQDRLSWDQHTGQFSIRRLQTEDSGDYAVNVNETSVSFKLSVYDAVREPKVTSAANVSSGSCTLLCVVDQLSGGTLSWYEGEDLVNQTRTQLSLSLTVDRLGLQSSYRCVSANPAGNLTQSVNINTSCPGEQLTGDEDNSDLKPNRLVWIVIPIILLVLSICVIIIFVCVKRRKTGRDPQASIQQKGAVTKQEEAQHGHCYTHVRYIQIQAKENLKD